MRFVRQPSADYTASLNFREFSRPWLPVFLWMALMFFGSTDLMSSEHTSRFLTPFLRWWNPDISPDDHAAASVVRKAAHVTEYAILTGLLFRAFRGSTKGFWRRAALALVPALVFAPADDFINPLSLAFASPVDVLIDYSGASLAFICHLVLRLTRSRSTRRESSLSQAPPVS